MAPSALIEGTADLGPMARPMRSDERQGFVSKYGYEPTQIKTALAAAAVYVHADNPISKVSFEALESVYSAEPTRSGRARPALWRELGVKGGFGDREIQPMGRESGSSVAGYFRQRVLLQKPFRSGLMTTSDLKSMYEAISMNIGAISFGSVDKSVPAGVRTLKVSKEEDGKAFLPTEDTIADGTYPLSRYLNIYVVRTPGEPLDPSVTDFLHFVLSRQGQELVKREGMLPLSPELVAEELAKLSQG
jgi:phosphate transport system substrate-binding protein